MTRFTPTLDRPSKGHPILITIGGAYEGSPLIASTVSFSRDHGDMFEMKIVGLEDTWTWKVGDFKWRKVEDIKVDYWGNINTYLNPKMRKVVKKYGGAWVMRLRQ